MNNFLGIDTSNYSTSVAIYSESGEYESSVKLLPVAHGDRGLRQSDALFHHVKAFPTVLNELVQLSDISAVGVSSSPRNVSGSYMPCFLAGTSFAQAISIARGVPLYTFSHQQGHIAAGLLSVGREDLTNGEFYAFHLSGGTMELLHVDTLNKISHVCVTKDVTAGQLIDRVGVSLGYDFPAGKKMSELAEKGRSPIKYRVNVTDGGMNLSGIENKALDLIKADETEDNIAAFVMTTIARAVRSAIEYAHIHTAGKLPVLMVGGVSSSSVLRRELSDIPNIMFASPDLSRDNAVGIAYLTSLTHRDKLENGMG